MSKKQSENYQHKSHYCDQCGRTRWIVYQFHGPSGSAFQVCTKCLEQFRL